MIAVKPEITSRDVLWRRIVDRTLRVPLEAGPPGDGKSSATQLDAALITAGFKLAPDLLQALSAREAYAVQDIGRELIAVVKRKIGDHVRHNSYFLRFPDGVPNTVDFWAECLEHALGVTDLGEYLQRYMAETGMVNLLDLPRYGRYLHTYEEMLAAHEPLIPAIGDRLTILSLGTSLEQEARELYAQLAGRTTPLSDDDRNLLRTLAGEFPDETPAHIPIRENLAIINATLLHTHQPIVVDTATDLLRLACEVSGGDPTLATPTKFRSFPRRTRRVLLAALEDLIGNNAAKISDIGRYSEEWKRLGEWLHPHEYPEMDEVQRAFRVARGDLKIPTFAASIERQIAAGDWREAIHMFSLSPGMLARSFDRVLRSVDAKTGGYFLEVFGQLVGDISSRVLLSLLEHLFNRTYSRPAEHRIFTNTKGRTWVAPDMRATLPEGAVAQAIARIEEELVRRLPPIARMTLDPAMVDVALPLSEKLQSKGFGILPAGSETAITSSLVRYFIYWREEHKRTDYDLSTLLLSSEFEYLSQTSWTSLRGGDGAMIHSGDITSAPDGASEFIDVSLDKIGGTYVIPQVNVFSGEGFDEAAEAFFGVMERDPTQRGAPYEPSTVRVKSDLYGRGKVALPVVLRRLPDGNWRCRWLHLYLNGRVSMNRVEGNRLSTSMLVRASLHRQRLTVFDLAIWYQRAGTVMVPWGDRVEGPVTVIALETPEGVTAGQRVITPGNLADLLPR